MVITCQLRSCPRQHLTSWQSVVQTRCEKHRWSNSPQPCRAYRSNGAHQTSNMHASSAGVQRANACCCHDYCCSSCNSRRSDLHFISVCVWQQSTPYMLGRPCKLQGRAERSCDADLPGSLLHSSAHGHTSCHPLVTTSTQCLLCGWFALRLQSQAMLPRLLLLMLKVCWLPAGNYFLRAYHNNMRQQTNLSDAHLGRCTIHRQEGA